ncbi:right-handed parallel beta-helix repeat-containing protein [Anaeromicrobium sediminis]|uniref:Periplasmic copper-binding protein NosD beta helix domain-containing protein n=1 Tax=Anaeromicrobium sediminis TaxID=1478221 RepID=A0A267MNX1_9FIRM|nr:NosD domain-containing protein [Anaeromicrobium sediminis]PAB61289.1 hypothetical protein CCE28_02335 [Anaeromicrobium sediminis]
MAIINVPDDFSTIQEAVNSASEGDVILVKSKENNQPYNEEVTITTDNIRIVANGKDVVLQGTVGSLNPAFRLSNVTGVEIKGFKIQNYHRGILIDDGSFNRIIRNETMDTSDGITCVFSSGNLIWKNEVKGNGTGFGICAIEQANSNWITENVVHGYVVGLFIATSAGNALVGNLSFNNEAGFALFDGASNTLLLCNEVFKNENNFGVNVDEGPNSVFINNKIKYNDESGLLLRSSQNCFVSKNELKKNNGNGIITRGVSNFNIIQENKIEKNKENGINLATSADKNTIIRNCIECNNEDGINIEGDENNIVQNKVCNNKVLDIDDNGTDNEFADNKCRKSDPQDICKNCHYKYYHYGHCPYKDYYCEYCPYKDSEYCPCKYEHDD